MGTYTLCQHVCIIFLKFIVDTARRKGKGDGEAVVEEDPGIPPPPELPKNTAAPWINIPTSVYQEDMKKLLDSKTNADVHFILGSKVYCAHRWVVSNSCAQVQLVSNY
jgi:hypothetical protein